MQMTQSLVHRAHNETIPGKRCRQQRERREVGSVRMGPHSQTCQPCLEISERSLEQVRYELILKDE